MERMREQRVKQIASRIVEAALGIGKEHERVRDGVKRKWRYQKRPEELLYYEDNQGVGHGDRRFKACHAVVIENLRNYRPDELQTRRENRGLMNWSAGKVRKYLEEACQLHGLHLREVLPNYTSRQCSRTGLPGMRCDDVAVAAFVKPHWRVTRSVKALAKSRNCPSGAPWDEQLAATLEAAKQKSEDPNAPGELADCYVVEQFARWNAADKTWTDADSIRWTLKEVNGKPLWEIVPGQSLRADKQYKAPAPVRCIAKGGDLFVPVIPWSCRNEGHRPCPLCDPRSTVQADLNAAANIGLRALLDPDFAGKWWYVPATVENGWRVPAPKSCAGAVCLEGWKVAPKDRYLSADGTPLSAADDDSVKQAEAAVAQAKSKRDALKKAIKKAGVNRHALEAAEDKYKQAQANLKEAKNARSQKEVVNIWQDPSALGTGASAGRWWESSAYWNIVKSRVIARLGRSKNLTRENEG